MWLIGTIGSGQEGDTMSPETMWVVVFVKRGVSVLVGAYRDEETALSHSQALTKDMDANDDDVGVFCVEIEAQPSDSRVA